MIDGLSQEYFQYVLLCILHEPCDESYLIYELFTIITDNNIDSTLSHRRKNNHHFVPKGQP